jgi:hypothetical protein
VAKGGLTVGSGNGRTGTQKLKRYDLEDFNPRRSEDATSETGSREIISGTRDLGTEAREQEEPDPTVRRDTADPIPVETRSPPERRSPADAYKSLHDFLETFDSDTVMISFAALENMIKRKLPPSARERETWWTNKPRGRGHAKAWLDIGWLVEHVDLRKGRVTFTRLG